MKPIEFEYSTSTGEYTHIDETNKRTEITSLPPHAPLKAVIVRAEAMGLKVKKERP